VALRQLQQDFYSSPLFDHCTQELVPCLIPCFPSPIIFRVELSPPRRTVVLTVSPFSIHFCYLLLPAARPETRPVRHPPNMSVIHFLFLFHFEKFGPFLSKNAGNFLANILKVVLFPLRVFISFPPCLSGHFRFLPLLEETLLFIAPQTGGCRSFYLTRPL